MNSDKMSDEVPQSDESIDSGRSLLEEETVVENSAEGDGSTDSRRRLLEEETVVEYPAEGDGSTDSSRRLLEEETVVENPAVVDGTESLTFGCARTQPRKFYGWKAWTTDWSTFPPRFIYRGIRGPLADEMRRLERVRIEAENRERLENERRRKATLAFRLSRLNKWRIIGMIFSILCIPILIGFCYYAAHTGDALWILAAVGVGLNSVGCCFCCFAGRICLSSLWRRCRGTTSTNDQQSTSLQIDVESLGSARDEEASREGSLRGRGSLPQTPGPSNETTSTGSCSCSIPSEDGVAILNTSAQVCAFKRPSYQASRTPIVPKPEETSTSGVSQTSSSADGVVKGPAQSRQEYVPKPEETSTSEASQTSSADGVVKGPAQSRQEYVPKPKETSTSGASQTSSADDVVKDPAQSSQEYVTASEGLSSGELRRRKFLSQEELPQLSSSSSSDEEPKN